MLLPFVRFRSRQIVAPLLFWSTFALLSTARAQSMAELATPHEGRSMRSTSTQVGEDGRPVSGNADNSRVKPGEAKVVLDAKGPGAVTHMWFTFLGPGRHDWAPEGSATHQEMTLRIFYDGHRRPDIEVPFGDFFANCFGKRVEVISMPVVVEDGDSYNCFWHMPFEKSIRVEVVNESPSKNINLLYYNIDWIRKDRLPPETPYFYARYRQGYPVESGKDYVVLETEGKGHYVGTVLAVRTRSPAWFGEGDEKIYINGEKEPSIWGTGTEDYFLSAWGLKTTGTPYFGTAYFDQWGIVGGHTSAYRWHVEDPIVFEKSIKVTFEHWGWMSVDENPEGKQHSWNEREDDYASVAFWYQTGRPTPGPPLPPGEKRVLPNLDLIFPAEKALEEKKHGRGIAAIQKNLDFHPNGQLFYKPPSEENAWVEIPFTVKEKEPRRLVLAVTKAPDYGRYRARLNGVELGTADLYDEKVVPHQWHLLDFWPEPGEYTLRLECIGKSDRSSGHYLGIESVRLRERRPRVHEYGHDQRRDWKENPVLYR